MRKTRYVLVFKSMPRKLPIISFVVIWLLMDRFHTPEWAYGIFWFLVIVIIVAGIVDCYTHEEKSVDIEKFLKNYYEAQEQDKKIKEQQDNKSRWQQRYEDLTKKH